MQMSYPNTENLFCVIITTTGDIDSVFRRVMSNWITAECGAPGGAVGFAAGFAWSSYTFAETRARGALTYVAALRDQHWLNSHPIDHAEEQGDTRPASISTYPSRTRSRNLPPPHQAPSVALAAFAFLRSCVGPFSS